MRCAKCGKSAADPIHASGIVGGHRFVKPGFVYAPPTRQGPVRLWVFLAVVAVGFAIAAFVL